MADRVSQALRRLQARFSQAEAHVDITWARARTASARRLREILAKGPAGRVAGLHDPCLTPADRAELERALAETMPRRGFRARATTASIWHRLLRHVRYRRRRLTTLVLFLGLTCVAGWIAWARTPADAMQVRLRHPYYILWTLPDGQTLTTHEVRGAKLIWFKRGQQSYLRHWVDWRGYGEVDVPNKFICEDLETPNR